MLVFDAVRGDGDEPWLVQSTSLTAGAGADADLVLTFPVASKGSLGCGAVWGHLSSSGFGPLMVNAAF